MFHVLSFLSVTLTSLVVVMFMSVKSKLSQLYSYLWYLFFITVVLLSTVVKLSQKYKFIHKVCLTWGKYTIRNSWGSTAVFHSVLNWTFFGSRLEVTVDQPFVLFCCSTLYCLFSFCIRTFSPVKSWIHSTELSIKSCMFCTMMLSLSTVKKKRL